MVSALETIISKRVSNLAFKFNLRRYSEVGLVEETAARGTMPVGAMQAE
jgi:hypothetical protein